MKDVLKLFILKLLSFPFYLFPYKPTILLYHSISTKDHYISLSPDTFEKQLKYLKEKGFVFLKLEDFLLQKKFPKKSAMITFDDGLDDIFSSAVPLLKKYQIPAVFFIPVNLLGKDYIVSGFKCMTKEQLKSISADPLFEIGAHTMTHRKLIYLDDRESLAEIRLGKDALESMLDREIVSFVAPFGKYAKRELNFLQASGYRLAFVSNFNHLHKRLSPFEIPRFVVDGFTSSIFPLIFRGGLEFYFRVHRFVFGKKTSYLHD